MNVPNAKLGVKRFPRIVVARRWTGLGDCLASLLAAHRYARATNRSLVVDWRSTAYAPQENLFPLVFDAPRVWEGVETEAVDPRRGFAIDSPTWPAGWTTETLANAHLAGERGDPAAAVEHIAYGIDVDAPVVVFDTCIAPLAPAALESRRLLGALAVREKVRREVEGFARERFAGRPVLGLHVRHGNGGALGEHARHWTKPGDALIRIADRARSALAALEAVRGTAPVLFLCTDSVDVERMLARMLPGVVTRPKRFRAPGAGDLHLDADAPSGLFDAMVEMLLLGEVDRLLRYPDDSYFSCWGATMAGRRAPGPGNLPRAGSSNLSTGSRNG